MSREGDILDQLKKRDLPVVPAAFFDQFADEVMQLVDLENKTDGFLDDLNIKHLKNDLSSNFSIDYKRLEGLSNESIKKTVFKRNRREISLWLTAVAASFILLLSLPFLQNDTTELSSNLSAEEVLLSYLDEDDLIDFMLTANDSIAENDAHFEDEVFYEELEDELYNYLNEIQ